MRFLAMLLMLWCAGAQAVRDPEQQMIGTWVDDDIEAPYTMVIAPNGISWTRLGGLYCSESTFKIVSKESSATFPTEFALTGRGRTFEAIKLGLKKSCTKGHLFDVHYLQLFFQPDLEGYVEVVGYDKNDKASVLTHFHRQVSEANEP